MKFIIMEPSPLIIIPIEPKYLTQDSVFNTLSLNSSFNVRDHVSQPYSTNDGVTVYKFSFKNLKVVENIKVFQLNNNINFLH